MNKIEEIKSFYTGCMMCNNSDRECPGIKKSGKVPENANWVPRGFYFESPNIDILIVAKNPGHLTLKELENRLYEGKKDKELFQAYYNFRQSLANKKESQTTFHRNLYRYIRFFLNPEEQLQDYNRDEVIDNAGFKRVAFTNLVKCSTELETGKLNKTTMKTCYKKHLLDEIKLFAPKVILCCGTEVFKFLSKNKVEIGIPVISIKHPSYFYKRELEREILTNIKSEIVAALTLG